jgi:hypothetical protein
VIARLGVWQAIGVDEEVCRRPTAGASPAAKGKTTCKLVLVNNGMASIPLFTIFCRVQERSILFYEISFVCEKMRECRCNRSQDKFACLNRRNICNSFQMSKGGTVYLRRWSMHQHKVDWRRDRNAGVFGSLGYWGNVGFWSWICMG